MQATTLYEKLGGEQAIKQVFYDFYTRVLADDTVNFFFAHTDTVSSPNCFHFICAW